MYVDIAFNPVDDCAMSFFTGSDEGNTLALIRAKSQVVLKCYLRIGMPKYRPSLIRLF